MNVPVLPTPALQWTTGGSPFSKYFKNSFTKKSIVFFDPSRGLSPSGQLVI